VPYITPNTAPTDYTCRRLFIPDSVDWIAAVSGAITELQHEWNWEQKDGISPQEAAELATKMYLDSWQGACMIGLITPYITGTLPQGCLPCDGSTHLRVDYPRLYDAIEPLLRIDADSFVTPDLRGRLVVPAADNFPLYSNGGQRHHTILIENLPSHDHPTLPHSHETIPHSHAEGIAVPTVINGGLEAPAAATSASIGTTGAAGVTVIAETVTVSAVGGGQPIEVMPPYVVLNYCVVAK
jgi:microcystin-dependent protein